MRGPAPKPPDQHANPGTAAAERARLRIVKSAVVPAPELPDLMPGGTSWPPETLHWWDCWVQDPLTDDYRQSDWLDLLDCALIHGRLWNGDDKAATELRLRMSKHGATKEDRAKLRITFSTADVVDVKAEEAKARKVVPKPDAPTARERRGGLTAVPLPTFSAEAEPGF